MSIAYPDQRCRLCGENALRVRLQLNGAPRNISRLLRQDELDGDSFVDLDVCECAECGLVQLPSTTESLDYDDYLMTVSHSPQMQAYQRRLARDFVERFNLMAKRVVDVGCGDGNFMQCLREAGALVSGVEPSAQSRRLASERGFTVWSGYVLRDAPIPDGPYDAFVTRQVLEHAPDPIGFLREIRRSLFPDGVGLIEVPSLEKSVGDGRFFDFFADHLNYFSEHTLHLALQRSGFEVTDCRREMNGEYNVALVRASARLDVTSLQAAVDSTRRDMIAAIVPLAAQGKRVAVWGSGGKGIAALAAIPLPDVAYVIDSDPHKQGLFTPVSHLPVVAPHKLLEDRVDVVLVTALAYRDEIVAQLRDELGFKGRVMILGSDQSSPADIVHATPSR